MDIILIAGLWLDGSIWNDVAVELQRYGHRPLPQSLPGCGRGSTTATFDDQVAAVVAAVDTADRPMVVGHSAACSLAWVVADQRPAKIACVVLVGGFPVADGAAYADFFATVDGDDPELARADHVRFIDIESGHWPMVSRPAELARLFDMAATEA